MPDSSLNPLDVPGFLPERRETVRRADDRTIRERCVALLADIGKMSTALFFLGAVVVTLASVLGLKISGPPQEIAAMVSRQDSIESRVGRLEQGATLTHEQLGGLATDVQFLSYMLCVKEAGRDPVAESRCTDIIRAQRHPSAASTP